MNGVIAWLAGLVLVLCAVSGAARAETVAGPARLIDGDTIEVAGRVVRLHGIDAPETAQRCLDAEGRRYACGEAATRALARLIGAVPVTCAGNGVDRYKRLIAVCRTDAGELNRRMVADGMALAYTRYSDDYLAEQIDAAKAGRGLHAGTFAAPGDDRAARWASAAALSPDGCPIKGNVSSAGRIYHTPWSRDYARTRIDPARGERWFCSEAEALAAGWRAPRR